MNNQPHNGPINPVPPYIMALFLVLIGIEAVLSLADRGIIGGPLAVGWRMSLLEQYAFSPRVFWWMVENRVFPAEHMIRFVSYAFIHGTFTHALFGGVFVLALGKMVGERFGALATMAVFFVATVVGAITYALFVGGEQLLFGAYPGAYGLIGGFTYLLWLRMGEMGEAQVRAFSLIGMLLGVQLLFAVLFSGPKDWVADIGGFAAGFLLSFAVSPGGWTKILDKLRPRSD